MKTITKLKYQNATEMFRKPQTTPLMNDEKIMNFPGNLIETLIFWQTNVALFFVSNKSAISEGSLGTGRQTL